MAKRYAGYIAIDRGIFDHWIARDPKRFMAWEWLIAQAAHAPQGKRGTWGVVHLERGELIGSERMLAHQWRWSRGAVERFLDRLLRDGMIARRTTRHCNGALDALATKTEPPTEPPTVLHLEHDITIITICKYDTFQKSSTAAKPGASHQPSHRPENDAAQTPMLPGFLAPLTTKPLNQRTESLGDGGEGEGKITAPAAPKPDTGPRHGARGKHGGVFIRYGTDEWRLYAEDFKAVTGAEPLPGQYGGKWFYANGEAARPGHQRTWRDPNAFGAASRGGRR